jgi:phytoene synthase
MNMIVSQVATYVASSDCQAIADDALKDEDNGLWLMAVPASMHQSWFQRFQWIRWLDRLAEQDQIVQAGGVEFAAFRAAWQQLATTGQLPTQTDHSGMAGGAWPILEDLHRTWFADGKPGDHPLEMAGWQEYVDAIARYHRPHFTLETLADYEAMLDHLAGACFQFLPDLTPEQRAIARPFGMVDQCYNILRDLYEDARQGICYFPQEVLQEFGVTRRRNSQLHLLRQPGLSAPDGVLAPGLPAPTTPSHRPVFAVSAHASYLASADPLVYPSISPH